MAVGRSWKGYFQPAFISPDFAVESFLDLGHFGRGNEKGKLNSNHDVEIFY